MARFCHKQSKLQFALVYTILAKTGLCGVKFCILDLALKEAQMQFLFDWMHF